MKTPGRIKKYIENIGVSWIFGLVDYQESECQF